MDLNFFSKICEIPGAPGHEHNIRDYVKQSIESYVDECRVDNIGNLIAVKKGTRNPQNKKVLVAAHLDEIGFIVTAIDDKGFVRFHTLGGFDPKTLTAQRVIIHGKKDIIGVMGSKPIHVMTPEERNAVPKITDYFIDTGFSKEELLEFIKVGDVITRERTMIEMGACVNCKSLDNRVSVFILIETLRRLQEIPYDLYAVFTVQEEMGGRGATVAAHQVNPDFGIALDTTIAYDVPGAREQEMVTKLGQGAAIKIMDSSVISDIRMVSYMKALAESHQIKWQPEILTGGNTDTAALQRNGKNGSIAGAISIPTRHIHQVIEMVHKQDVEDCIALLKVSLEHLDDFKYEY
ncbi:MAG TPA: M42 family metallopeptidase [Cytophagales bacterium]|nr:M42 family metallopeptidase [Cytophagales bacterium]